MPPDVLHNLWERWDNDPPLFHADEVQGQLGSAFDRLVTLGLLRESAPAECAPCWDCGDGFVGRITCVHDASTGHRRAYIHCPECGVKEVSFDHLRRWVVPHEDALGVLANASGLAGGVTECVTNHLWRIGYGVFSQHRRDVYFARNVYDANCDDIVAVLVKRPKALLLVPTPANAERWQSELPHVTVALEDAFAFTYGQIRFDAGLVESRYAEIDSLPRPHVPKRRAVRSAKIEKLTSVLVAHLQAARDHAFTRQAQTGVPELLPRPMQQELARMLGMSETDVSRCLKDKSARELRIYWQTASQLDHIMKWPGRTKIRA